MEDVNELAKLCKEAVDNNVSNKYLDVANDLKEKMSRSIET